MLKQSSISSFFCRHQPFLVAMMCILISLHLKAAPPSTQPARELPLFLIDGFLSDLNFIKAHTVISNKKQACLPGQPELAEWLLAECNTYLAQGMAKEASHSFAEAEKLMIHFGNPPLPLRFQYLLTRGNMMAHNGRFSSALLQYAKAKNLLPRISRLYPQAELSLFSQETQLLISMGDHENAFASAKRAMNACNSFALHHPYEQLYLKSILADAYKSCGQTENSESLIRDCIRELAHLQYPFHPGLLKTYLLLLEYDLDSFGDQGTYDKVMQQSSLLAVKFLPNNHFLYGSLYTIKAQFAYYNSDFTQAQQYSQQALQILRKFPLQNDWQYENHIIMAQTYFWLKRDYAKTIEYCKKTIAQWQPAYSNPTYFYYMIGVSSNMLGNRNQTLKYLNKVISLCSIQPSGDNMNYCSLAYFELGRLYLMEGLYNQCRIYFFKAMECANQTSAKRPRYSTIYLELANSYRHTGQYTLALKYVQKAIAAGCRDFSTENAEDNPPEQKVVLTQNVINALNVKAYIYYKLFEKEKKLQHLKIALRCQDLAVRLLEKWVIDLDDEDSGLIVADEMKLALNNAVSYAVMLYLETQDREYAERAWIYAEKSKMQIMAVHALKKHNLLTTGLPDSVTVRYQHLGDAIHALENRLMLMENQSISSTRSDRIMEELTRLYDERELLFVRMEERFPKYKNAKYNHAVAGMKEVQNFLGKDQVILEYQMLKTELITFLVKTDSFCIYRQPIGGEVIAKVENLRIALSSHPLNIENQEETLRNFITASCGLYNLLLAPFADQLVGKRLIIIPHNILTTIPFEVLIERSPEFSTIQSYYSLDYLIKHNPLAYAYTANMLVERERLSGMGGRTAIFLPDYKKMKQTESFSLLPGAIEESESIHKKLGGRIYKGHEADETTFMRKAGKYRILHIASHTIVDETNPGLSYLVMSSPKDSQASSKLYSYEIMQMNLKAQLVVLSGCNTGYGILMQSEGLISIARSFFYAGVRTAVYTLWPVADKAGSKLMVTFYQEICKGQDTDVSMQKAKIKYLEEADPLKNHPFYWSGYLLVGKSDPVCNHPHFRLCLGLAAALAIIALILIIYSRKPNG
jgi:CHAT domain-containing protein